MNQDLRKRTEELQQQLLAYASCEPGKLALKTMDYQAAAETVRELRGLLEATEKPTNAPSRPNGYRDRASNLPYA
jgi:hypothetical protein